MIFIMILCRDKAATGSSVWAFSLGALLGIPLTLRAACEARSGGTKRTGSSDCPVWAGMAPCCSRTQLWFSVRAYALQWRCVYRHNVSCATDRMDVFYLKLKRTHQWYVVDVLPFPPLAALCGRSRNRLLHAHSSNMGRDFEMM